MNKLAIIITVLLIMVSCKRKESSSSVGENPAKPQDPVALREMLVDSLLYFRHHYQKTNILSRHLPDITMQKAVEIQLRMLEKELAAGATQIGWKMAGTIAKDAAGFDPKFGYVLDKNLIEEDSVVSAKNFPGGQVAVEGEIGFVMKEDFKNGAESVEALKSGIDYVVNTVEFAQSIAIPVGGDTSTMNLNHAMASGMGQAGIIVGRGKADIEDFDPENERVKCFINNQLAAEGVATNVYGSPINALYALANLLPKHGTYLKKGDIIITGSLYQNPVINSTCTVSLEFSSLGPINFGMK